MPWRGGTGKRAPSSEREGEGRKGGGGGGEGGAEGGGGPGGRRRGRPMTCLQKASGPASTARSRSWSSFRAGTTRSRSAGSATRCREHLNLAGVSAESRGGGGGGGSKRCFRRGRGGERTELGARERRSSACEERHSTIWWGAGEGHWFRRFFECGVYWRGGWAWGGGSWWWCYGWWSVWRGEMLFWRGARGVVSVF